MSSKYELDKLLDPYGIKKILDSIATVKDPFNIARAQTSLVTKPGIFDLAKTQTSLVTKPGIFDLAKTQTSLVTKPGIFDLAKTQTSLATKPGIFDLAKIQTSLVTKPGIFDLAKIQTSLVTKPGIFDLAKTQTSLVTKPGIFDLAKIQTSLVTKPGIFDLAKIQTSLVTKPGIFDLAKIQTSLVTKPGIFDLAKIQTSLVTKPGIFDLAKIQTSLVTKLGIFDLAKIQTSLVTKSGIFDLARTQAAISKQARSIINNESLGLQADLQRLLAATTLSPELHTKILNFNKSVSNISSLIRQNAEQNKSDSVQEYLNTIENFNKKYQQKINIDRVTIQALDLSIHERDSLELTSELKNIGIFDTSSGSILFEYSKTLPIEKAVNFLNILLCLLMFLYEPVFNEYEPIKNHREEVANLFNGIEGKALITKNCDLRDQPNGLKIMSLEKESLVIVYKNKEISDEWSKIKFNKDGHDVTGYIRTSELNFLD